MTPIKLSLSDRIRHLRPCPEALRWLDGYTSAAKAWRGCQRGDYMLWLIGKQVTSPPWSDDRKPLLACCLDCAETVKHLWPTKQHAQIGSAIHTLRLWIDGKATNNDAAVARVALRAAAEDADADADANASAVAAAYAAANASASANASAANAAADAAEDAEGAADSATRKKKLAECADIVRRHYPQPPRIKAR